MAVGADLSVGKRAVRKHGYLSAECVPSLGLWRTVFASVCPLCFRFGPKWESRTTGSVVVKIALQFEQLTPVESAGCVV